MDHEKKDISQLLSLEHVSFSYNAKGTSSYDEYTLHDLSFQLPHLSTTAIVGESGSGKTTVAKLILGLLDEFHGNVFIDNIPLQKWLSDKQNTLSYRKKVQLIFQDPDSSLNPKMSLGEHLNEALSIHFPDLSESEKDERINTVLQEVSLPENIKNRFAFEISGGQKQRLIISRALLIQPELLILDEPLSSLDASIRKSIIALLSKLYSAHKMTYLYVTHDLSTVPHLAKQVIIMYRGVIVEDGEVDEVFRSPVHPYTQLLIESVPTPDPVRERKKKRLFFFEKSKPLPPTKGCVFAHRCPFATALCRNTPPQLADYGNHGSHRVRCHYPDIVKGSAFNQEAVQQQATLSADHTAT